METVAAEGVWGVVATIMVLSGLIDLTMMLAMFQPSTL